MAGRSPPPRSMSTTTVRSPSARTPSVLVSELAPESSSRAPSTSAISEASGDGSPGMNRRRQLWTTSDGSQRRTVAELQAGAQRERDLPALVRDGPRLRERGADGERRVHGGQGLVQLADVRRAAEIAVLRGIDGGRGAGHDRDGGRISGDGGGRGDRPRAVGPRGRKHRDGHQDGEAADDRPAAT